MTNAGPMEGYRAPDLCLPESSGKDVYLREELKERPVVLRFHPTDFGITCTLEFKRFKEMSDDFARSGVALVGISVNSIRSHLSWKDVMGLSFPLLRDFDTKVSRLYDVMSPEDSILKGHSTRAIFLVD